MQGIQEWIAAFEETHPEIIFTVDWDRNPHASINSESDYLPALELEKADHLLS